VQAPSSEWISLTDEEIGYVVQNSKLVEKYNQSIDRDSAYEMLSQKQGIEREREQGR
jgi:hypothetical protein